MEKATRAQKEHLKSTKTPSTSARIQSVSSQDNTALLDIGTSPSSIPHPFISGKSWRRSIPRVGTRCTVSFNQTENRFDIVSYAPDPAITKQMNADYENNVGLFRPLQEGEHEDVSSGNVVEFMGSRPVKSGNAGCVSWRYDGDKLEASINAPTHVTRLHTNKNDRLGNEKRFGVAKRPVSGSEEMYLLAGPLSNPATGTFKYTYEDVTLLSNDNNAPLIDFRAGEVFDDVPTTMVPFAVPALSKNGLPLRARYKFHNTIEPGGLKTPNQSTNVEVDNLGNIDVLLSKLALFGLNLKTPTGSVNVNAGQFIELVSKLGVAIKSELASIKLQALQNIELIAKQKITTSSLLDTTIEAGKNFDISAKLSGKVTANTSLDLEGKSEVNIGSVKIKVDATGIVTIQGHAGLKLAGAAGFSGRPISTNPFCYVTGLPNFIDPTLSG